MRYEAFLEGLKTTGWHVPDSSYACGAVGEWQIAFIRLGGRLQRAGHVTFVVCIRHRAMRNVDGQPVEHEKNPNSFPFRLTLADIESGCFAYQRKLNFETSELASDEDWSVLWRHMTETLPTWLRRYKTATLAAQIHTAGEPWYVENIWLEDLPPTPKPGRAWWRPWGSAP